MSVVKSGRDMKAKILICCVLALTFSALSCPLDTDPGISVTEESLAIRVMEVEGGITIENLSGVACIVFVRSPEGEQEFEVAAGESVTVTGITPRIEACSVSL